MIITRTPYRISLFGGGTDFPEWYIKNSGAVLSFTINKHCYISLRELPPFFKHKFRISYSKLEEVKDVKEIEHPVVREVFKKYAPKLNLELNHLGDLPANSGIGSSSAFTVGVISAVNILNNVHISSNDLANCAIELEQKILLENVGSQDQVACSLGGINFIEFNKGDSWTANPIKLSSNYSKQLEASMVLIFSGISRFSSNISKTLISNMSLKSDLLLKTKLLAESCNEIFKSEGDLDQVGMMLNEAWVLKQKLNPQSVTPILSELFEKAYKSGATGGKVLGAGGGGFCLFWVDHKNRDFFIEQMKPAINVPFKISEEGTSRVL